MSDGHHSGIAGEGLQNLGLSLALTAFKQGVWRTNSKPNAHGIAIIEYYLKLIISMYVLDTKVGYE